MSRRRPSLPPRPPGVLVLDSGVLGSLATPSSPARGVWRRLTQSGWSTVIPAVTLAEATTGRGSRDAAVNLAIRMVGDALPCDEVLARLAGALRFSAIGRRPRVSGVDAIVAAVACAHRPSAVLTTDPHDLGALLSRVEGVQVIGV